MGRFAALGPIINLWAATRPLALLYNGGPLCSPSPIFGKQPEFGEFTLGENLKKAEIAGSQRACYLLDISVFLLAIAYYIIHLLANHMSSKLSRYPARWEQVLSTDCRKISEQRSLIPLLFEKIYQIK